MRPDAPVQWHETIDSTNEEARRLAQAGHYGPIWIASQQQTAGRGRLGRQWQSPAGNLYCSALFLEPGGIQVATRYPFAAGLAIADVCDAIVGNVGLRLKWPNDVRVKGAKLCGILVEAGTSSDGACWIVAGMGLNVVWSPDSLDQPATDLAKLGAPSGVDAPFVIDALRRSFAARRLQAQNDFAKTLKDWQMIAEGLGETVRIGKGDDAKTGRFVGLDTDGGLKLEHAGGRIETIRAGDVELVREIKSDAARD